MKKGAKYLFRPAAIGIMMLLTIAGLQAQLVTNGSFEESSIGPVSGTEVNGWVIEVDGTISPAPTIEIISDTVQSGSRALKFGINAVGPNAYSIQLIGDSIPVIPGETYRATIWAKAQNAGGQAVFSVGNYAYDEYGQIRPSSPNITTSWQQFSFSFTIDDQQTYARAPIHFNFATNVGNTIYIDNLKIVNINDSKRPVIVEAESGTLGSDFSVLQDGSTSYLSIQTNTVNSGNPGNTNRIATYNVTFPDTGIYNLFARIRVGSGTFNDDSFFYGNGFGVKDTVDDNEWMMANGLMPAGFSGDDNVVNEPGGLGNGVWKWVNLSKNLFTGEQGITFRVGVDSLDQTFQIGGREDGLDIDKLAFGKATLYFTVKSLDSIQMGSADISGQIWQGPPLASKQSKFVGCAHSAPQAINFTAYWNQVVAENGGKWASVEGTRNTMTWSSLDEAYNLAKTNGFPYRHHVLIWGAQQPAWIETLTAEEQLQEIDQWFNAVAARYPDIEYLEVVNEALHQPPDAAHSGKYINALGGAGATGWDWLITAFRMAREIFPDSTKLMLNEYSITNNTASAHQYLDIIRLLQAEDLIDAIGVQGHAFSTTGSMSITKACLDSLATTGLPIIVTEMDINASDNAIQLQDYKRIFPTFYEHPGVEGITLWGWKVGTWQTNAYLIDQSGTERPALVWLREYLDTVSLPVVGVEEIAEGPKVFRLYNNYPNPFNPATQIKYSISHNSYVSLKVYNVIGQEVATVFDGNQNAGTYTAVFDGSRLSSGVYFYRLQANQTNGKNNFAETKKLMLLK